MASLVDERGFNQGFALTEAQQVRLRRRAQAIVDEMSLPTDLEKRRQIRILEIGCGTGEMAVALADLTRARVTGADLSAHFIEQARATYRREGLDFVVADLSETAAESGETYDYIVGNGILHHLYHDLDSVLPALARWLVPNGRIIFWEPNLVNPYVFLLFSVGVFRRLGNLEPDEMAFSAAFIRNKLCNAGFCDVRVQPQDFLLPNTPTFLISPVIKIGAILECLPVMRSLAQSLFISAAVPRRVKD